MWTQIRIEAKVLLRSKVSWLLLPVLVLLLVWPLYRLPQYGAQVQRQMIASRLYPITGIGTSDPDTGEMVKGFAAYPLLIAEGRGTKAQLAELKHLYAKAQKQAQALDRVGFAVSVDRMERLQSHFLFAKTGRSATDMRYLAKHHLGYYADFDLHSPALSFFVHRLSFPYASLLLVACGLMIAYWFSRFRRQRALIALLPRTRTALTLGRFGLVGGLALGSALLAIAISLLPGIAMGGLGAQYRQGFYLELADKTTYIRNDVLFWRYLGWLCVFIVFLLCLVFCLDQLFGHFVVSGAVVFVVLMVGQAPLYQAHQFEPKLAWLPSTYTNLYDMITPGTQQGLALDANMGLVVLAGWSVALLALGLVARWRRLA